MIDQIQNRRPNDWLLDDSYLELLHVDSKNLEHFISTCKRLYTSMASFPSPVRSTWNDSAKEFYFYIGSNYLSMKYNPFIDEFDFSEIVNRWAYRFYPGYSIEVDDFREYTPEEIAYEIQNGTDPDEVFNKKLKFKKTIDFKIEKMIIKDDQITASIDGSKYILITRADMPVSKFISALRKIETPIDRKEYVDKYTKSILEIVFYKSIEIKFDFEVLKNFFKINVLNLKDEAFKSTENNLIYKWGRFIIYFSSEEQVTKCKAILSRFKTEYLNSDVDTYLRKEFDAKIGVANHSKE
jgi:hypothetical protein